MNFPNFDLLVCNTNRNIPSQKYFNGLCDPLKILVLFTKQKKIIIKKGHVGTESGSVVDTTDYYSQIWHMFSIYGWVS